MIDAEHALVDAREDIRVAARDLGSAIEAYPMPRSMEQERLLQFRARTVFVLRRLTPFVSNFKPKMRQTEL